MADLRLRRKLRSATRAMQRRQRLAGTWLLWYPLDYENTSSDPVYSTGPNRRWLAPITVPALSAWVTQEQQQFSDQGLYLVDRFQAVISREQFEAKGMTLFTSDHHVNDRVKLDGELFGVDAFLPGGKVAGDYMMISVSGRQIMPDELEEETGAPWEEQPLPPGAPTPPEEQRSPNPWANLDPTENPYN